MKNETSNNLPDFINSIYEKGVLNIDSQQIKVKGFSNINNLILLQKLILERNIKNTLEIGLAYGGSATLLLHTLKQKLIDNFSHTAIDPYQSSWMKNYGVKHVDKLGFSNNFKFFENFSELVLPELLSQNKKFDLIYIDGSHLFENVFIDAYYSFQLLNINGILIFDDCADKGVFKAITNFKRINSTSIKKVDIRKYVKYSRIKNLLYPMASKLGKVQMQVFEKTNDDKKYWGK
ncbi:MAG: class I SAM-dependent methyltransferase [Cyclobacteriaceae bacterium]|nr:class I SAM-dependent methyltransferase [Cyclobacteriaceae bacterium]